MPDDPLLNWHEWNLPLKQKPALIRQLTVGRTNQSYLIEADNLMWVLRVNAINSEILGIDRQREKIILENASEKGLAPEILYCSVEHGVLITKYIEGYHWQPSEIDDPQKFSLLIEGVELVHALTVPTTAFNYQQHAENYWQQLLGRNIIIPDKLHRQRDKFLPMLARIPDSNTICHHDLNPQNIIFSSGKLYFLDWEYAAPGWPVFDLATLSAEWNIAADKMALRAAIDPDVINDAKNLYYFLCDLWSCLQRDKAMDS